VTPHAKRVGILFSGGPAPAANSVISSAALAFLNKEYIVIGFREGFKYLEEANRPEDLVEGKHYWKLTYSDVTNMRNEPAIMLKTSRTNPATHIRSVDDLSKPELRAPLEKVIKLLSHLELDALITIGGDDTLRTANCLYRVKNLFFEGKGPAIIHLPKTIDNDYFGIDWTFGFFSAADFAAREVRAIAADVKSAPGWFILEIMGRKSGWLTYAAGIAGEATRMFSVEDLEKKHLDEQGKLILEVLADDVVNLILDRERHDKHYGVVCVAEGLADKLTDQFKTLDPSLNPLLGEAQIGSQLASMVELRFKKLTGRAIRVRGKQIGYETRCVPPTAFDVLLGCQLGIGAFRAVEEMAYDGHMVSVEDQLKITFVPFERLVDQKTLKTRLRYIPCDSDFYRLARELEFKPWIKVDPSGII